MCCVLPAVQLNVQACQDEVNSSDARCAASLSLHTHVHVCAVALAIRAFEQYRQQIVCKPALAQWEAWKEYQGWHGA